MSIGNFNTCLNEILKHEGGYVNHPSDPGGITNLGITKKTYEEYVGRTVTIAEMKSLTPAIVAPIYNKKYWSLLSCDSIPSGLDLCVFDFGVNAGVKRSIKYLQLMVGVKSDGVLGPLTLKAVNEYVNKNGTSKAIKTFQEMRRNYYKKLSNFPVFGKGWLSRVDKVEKKAISMI